MAVLDPSTSPVLAPATAPKKPSVFEDFVDIFYAPRQVFARRRDGEFFAALVVLTCLVALLGYLFYSLLEPAFSVMTDRAVAAALKKNPTLREEQLRGMRGLMEKGQAFGPVIGVPIAALLGAVGIWVVAKFFDARQTMGQALTVSTYSMFPMLLAWITMAALSFVVPADQVQGLQSYMLSPARFLDANTANPGLLAALMRIEPFTLWGAYITAVGISETGKISLKQGIGAAAVVWLLGTLFSAGPALLQS
ncbi:MAG: YIP1 family protein [Gemmatimonadaceae bacterium]